MRQGRFLSGNRAGRFVRTDHRQPKCGGGRPGGDVSDRVPDIWESGKGLAELNFEQRKVRMSP